MSGASNPSSSTSGGSTAKNDYSFGQVAIRENCCTFEQVKECLDIQSKLRTLGIEPKRLGDILIEKGYLSAEQAVKISKLQAQSAAGSSKVTIPGYEVLSKIGAGAMGSVYKARQVSMDRIVAIKVLSPQCSRDRSFVERFLREARAVARLNHENVISGIDVGEVSGIHYFVMEYVDGMPVSTVMRKEGLITEKRCLEIGLQVARALAHAHKHGLIHRDVKPENIMITTAGVAKLCDLGLAKQTKGDAGATMDGMSVGTPNYISPEQARGEADIDIRTDIYSLGCSLYHMATGTTPFNGPNPMVVMTKHVTEWADPVRKRNPNLSQGFNDLVAKLMGKRREERPQDPEALIRDIETVLRGGALGGVPAGAGRSPTIHRASPEPAAPVRPRSRPPTTFHAALHRSRSPALGLALGAIGVVTVIVILVILVGGGPPPPPPTPPPVVPRVNPASTGSSGTTPEPVGRVQVEIKTLRELVLPELERNTRDDRYTFPYGKISAKIAESERDPIALKAWTEELQRFTKEADAAVARHSGWDEIRRKAKAHSDAGRFAQALEELGRLKAVYRFYREEEPPVLTKAGQEHKEMAAKIQADLREAVYTGVGQAKASFANPQTRDDAYGVLDALAVSVPADRKSDVEAERRKFIEAELRELVGEGTPTGEKLKTAQARLDALKALHAGNAPVAALLDTMSADFRKDAREARSAAMARAGEAYAAFRPGFAAALRARDLGAARKALNDLCLAPANMAVQSALLPAPAPDAEALRAFLDPARSGPYAEVKKIVSLAEEGAAFAQKQSNDAARGLYLDLRTAALIEDLVEQALEGAKVVSRDPARFKTFSPPLAGASAAEPAARKPGEAALSASFGASKTQVLLTPKAAGTLVVAEADLVELARRSPSAASDAYFPLKAFHLFHAADNLRASKTWYEQLKTPVLLMGLEGLAPRFANVLPESAEAEAKTLFEAAWDLYHKKKDLAGGKKKFQDCVEKYSGTDYMQQVVNRHGQTRIQVVGGFFGGGASRKVLGEVFGTADVRDLGRNRFEVVYTFKDDRELDLFVVGDGALLARRMDPGPGVRLQSNGVWYWNVPLSGNVLIEAVFQAAGEGTFGMVVCGEANRAGYLGVADIPIPGAAPLDALMKLPLGPQSLVASATSNLATQRGPNQATFQREGTRLRFTLNGTAVEAEHAEYTQGRAGIALGQAPCVVTRLKIVADVDAAWLEAETKRLGEK